MESEDVENEEEEEEEFTYVAVKCLISMKIEAYIEEFMKDGYEIGTFYPEKYIEFLLIK